MLQKRMVTLSGCKTQRYTPLTGFAPKVALDSKGHFLNQKSSGSKMLLHTTGAVLTYVMLLPHHLRAGSHSPARVVPRRAFHLNSMLHQNYKVCTRITNACRTRRPALPPSRSRTMGTLQRCAPPSTGSAEANPQRNQLDVGSMPQTHSRSLGTGTLWACALF